MGFWNFFSSKSIKIGDKFFGVMLFDGSRESAEDSGHFECHRYFKPADQDIEIGIDGNLSGPTQQQKDFFSWVEANYFSFTLQWIPIIERDFGAWMNHFGVRDFAQEFKPGYLSIPSCEQQPVAWEIVFDTVHDLNHTVTIGMLGHEPQYLRVDG